MDAEFWHQKWEKNEIGFHRAEVSPWLVTYLERLNLPPAGRVFLPLCGKTKDIGWLLGQGYRVLGVELSERAVRQLFDELGIEPTVTQKASLIHYQAERVDIFVGDIFGLDFGQVGQVDAVYDRAALVALPKETRMRYTKHLTRLTRGAPQLLVCYEYEQHRMEGPPFAILPSEVELHYSRDFQRTLLETAKVGGFGRAKCPATESIWLLRRGIV